MKPHRTDFVSLFFGLLFIALAGAFTVTGLLDLRAPSFGWFVAGAAIVLGLLGIIGALLPGRKAAPVVVAPQWAGAQPSAATARQPTAATAQPTAPSAQPAPATGGADTRQAPTLAEPIPDTGDE